MKNQMSGFVPVKFNISELSISLFFFTRKRHTSQRSVLVIAQPAFLHAVDMVEVKMDYSCQCSMIL